MTICVNLSNNFIIAKLEIMSKKVFLFLTNFHSPGLRITFSFGNNGSDLFKKWKQHSRELNMPSNSNMFFNS